MKKRENQNIKIIGIHPDVEFIGGLQNVIFGFDGGVQTRPGLTELIATSPVVVGNFHDGTAGSFFAEIQFSVVTGTGTGPFTWSGAYLPTGATLDAATGILAFSSDTPLLNGTWNSITITATDVNGKTGSLQGSITIGIGTDVGNIFTGNYFVPGGPKGAWGIYEISLGNILLGTIQGTAGDNASIYKTSDNGVSWNQQSSINPASFAWNNVHGEDTAVTGFISGHYRDVQYDGMGHLLHDTTTTCLWATKTNNAEPALSLDGGITWDIANYTTDNGKWWYLSHIMEPFTATLGANPSTQYGVGGGGTHGTGDMFGVENYALFAPGPGNNNMHIATRWFQDFSGGFFFDPSALGFLIFSTINLGSGNWLVMGSSTTQLHVYAVAGDMLHPNALNSVLSRANACMCRSMIKLPSGRILTADNVNVCYSDNLGVTWNTVAAPADPVERLVSTGGTHVIAGCTKGHIYKSTDSGLTWTHVTQLDARTNHVMDMKVLSDGSLWVTTQGYTGPAPAYHVFRSVA